MMMLMKMVTFRVSCCQGVMIYILFFFFFRTRTLRRASTFVVRVGGNINQIVGALEVDQISHVQLTLPFCGNCVSTTVNCMKCGRNVTCVFNQIHNRRIKSVTIDMPCIVF